MLCNANLRFPSPYGVSFILMYQRYFKNAIGISFRLLTELYSFLQELKGIYKGHFQAFPSPYGVLFILIFIVDRYKSGTLSKGFPSPYGVLFILISLCCIVCKSSIHSFPSPYGVLFILIRIEKALEV